MTSRPAMVSTTLLALLCAALAAAPAVADEGGGAPVFEHESEYDKPIYGPDDTDCTIYGKWDLYGRFSDSYDWTIEITRDYMITHRGERLDRIRSLKQKHFEAWPEEKIGFYGRPSSCRDNCAFVGSVHVKPHITLDCLLRWEGYLGTRGGYVDIDEYEGSDSWSPHD